MYHPEALPQASASLRPGPGLEAHHLEAPSRDPSSVRSQSPYRHGFQAPSNSADALLAPSEPGMDSRTLAVSLPGPSLGEVRENVVRIVAQPFQRPDREFSGCAMHPAPHKKTLYRHAHA